MCLDLLLNLYHAAVIVYRHQWDFVVLLLSFFLFFLFFISGHDEEPSWIPASVKRYLNRNPVKCPRGLLKVVEKNRQV